MTQKLTITLNIQFETGYNYGFGGFEPFVATSNFHLPQSVPQLAPLASGVVQAALAPLPQLQGAVANVQIETTVESASARNLQQQLAAHPPKLKQTLSPTCRFIDVDKEWLAALGYHLDELDRFSFLEIVDREGHLLFLENYIHLTAGKAVTGLNMEIRAKNGKTIPVSADFTPEMLDDKLYAINCSLQVLQTLRRTPLLGSAAVAKEAEAETDWQETLRLKDDEIRKTAEELLEIEEALEKAAQELNGLKKALNAVGLFLEFSPDGVITQANDLHLRLLGFSDNDLVGLAHHALFSPEAIEAGEPFVIWERILKGETVQGEWSHRNRSGQSVTLQCSYFPILDDFGSVLRVERLAVALPAAETEESEPNDAIRQLLEKNEEEIRQLSLIAQKTDNAVLITDREHKLLWVNPAFEKLSGYSIEEVLGRNPASFLHGPETNAETRDRIRARLENKETFSEEVLNYDKQGAAYRVLVNFTPLLDANGEVVRYIAIEREAPDAA